MGIENICKSKNCRNLIELDISDTKIDDEGIRIIA
jgi:hypothetical protein